MVPPYLFQKKACTMVSLIITQGPKTKLTAVSASEVGELIQHQLFNYLMMPYADKNSPEQYEADIQKLKEFIIESGAGLIIIGAQSPEARNLKNLIKDRIISNESTISRLGHEPWISYMTLELVTVAANSNVYIETMKSSSIEVRQGI